jgi:cobalt-zinc-cadmium resistance protein CzcA
MTATTAILGLLPVLVLPLHGTEIERPLAIVMVGGLLTSTAFTLIALRPSICSFTNGKSGMHVTPSPNLPPKLPWD